MLVKDFITKDFPVLKNFDTVEYALTLMEDLKVRHLPLLKDHNYQSLLSDKDLMAMVDPTTSIGEPLLFAPCILENGHLHEAMSIVSSYKLSLLPVVSIEGRYIGVITLDKLIEGLSTLCSADIPGSVIALELLPQDYVLSDIARIVESNNAHVLNLLSHTDKATGRLTITIKIDLEDASPVIRSFERFNYAVLYHFMPKGMVDEVLQQRMNELLYYMNM